MILPQYSFFSPALGRLSSDVQQLPFAAARLQFAAMLTKPLAAILPSLLGAALCAGAATAQIPQAVVDEEEAEQALSGEGELEEEGATSSERLFHALRDGESGEGVDALLQGAMTEVDARCQFIERYQVFNRASSFISMKVKCYERPVYILTVGPLGLGALSGGDGSIDRIRAGEGEIRVLQGEAPPPARPVGSSSLRRQFPMRAAAAVFGALILTGILLIWLWGRRQKAVAQWRGLKTEDKDRLLGESTELEPDLFKHPDGVWIARGSRGKRRFFQRKAFARLYRDYGLKVMQIR
ncbi:MULTISPECIES: hypothetical protein [Pacificimonas]|nr:MULTISPECIES: hypothetical protein [Pacificimonas]MBZ6377049.1 hypothetical protein [Pacificimonas aurantium]